MKNVRSVDTNNDVESVLLIGSFKNNDGCLQGRTCCLMTPQVHRFMRVTAGVAAVVVPTVLLTSISVYGLHTNCGLPDASITLRGLKCAASMSGVPVTLGLAIFGGFGTGMLCYRHTTSEIFEKMMDTIKASPSLIKQSSVTAVKCIFNCCFPKNIGNINDLNDDY